MGSNTAERMDRFKRHWINMPPMHACCEVRSAEHVKVPPGGHVGQRRARSASDTRISSMIVEVFEKFIKGHLSFHACWFDRRLPCEVHHLSSLAFSGLNTRVCLSRTFRLSAFEIQAFTTLAVVRAAMLYENHSRTTLCIILGLLPWMISLCCMIASQASSPESESWPMTEPSYSHLP